MNTGTVLRTLTGHTWDVRSVSFSPDGQTLASGSYKEIRLWDISTGTALRTLTGHTDAVYSVDRLAQMDGHSQVEVGIIPSVYGMCPQVIPYAHSQGIQMRSGACRLVRIVMPSRVGVAMARYSCGHSPGQTNPYTLC